MKSVYQQSFLYSLGAGVYITLVALFMNNAESIFGSEDSVFGVVAVLFLFTLSAFVVGGLIIGKPIMLYLDNKKKEAVRMLLANGVWLFLFFLIAISILAIKTK